MREMRGSGRCAFTLLDIGPAFRPDLVAAPHRAAPAGGYSIAMAVATADRGLPDVRPQPSQWRRADKRWEPTGDPVPDAWEVVCAECGDDGGPFERQSLLLQRIRGPFSDLRAAHVARCEHLHLDLIPPLGR